MRFYGSALVFNTIVQNMADLFFHLKLTLGFQFKLISITNQLDNKASLAFITKRQY